MDKLMLQTIVFVCDIYSVIEGKNVKKNGYKCLIYTQVFTMFYVFKLLNNRRKTD